VKVRRINRFRLKIDEEQENVLRNLCYMSAVLWNRLNYIRRQCFSKTILNGIMGKRAL